MPQNCELSTRSPTTCPRVTRAAVLVKDPTMGTLEVVVSLVLTMDTLEEVVNPVLMTGLAKVVAKAVANLALMTAATPKGTKVLALMMDQRAAAKAPASPVLMVDTLEVVANPALTMVTLEEENLALMMDTLAVEEEENPVTMTTMATEEEEMVEEMEVATMTMTLPCSPQTIFSQTWTSRTM